MFRKIMTIASITCVIITSIASMCFAYPTYGACGVWHAYNGSFWYDQGHVYVYGDPTDDYYVWVGLSYDNDTLTTGWRRTSVGAGHNKTCTSEQVQRSGGLVCYYPEVN